MIADILVTLRRKTEPMPVVFTDDFMQVSGNCRLRSVLGIEKNKPASKRKVKKTIVKQ